MKKILTIIISLLFVFSATNCTDKKTDDDTPKSLTVQKAVEAMEEVENFRFEATFKVDEAASDDDDMLYDISLEMQEGKMKLVVPIPEVSMSMTFYFYEKNEVEYLVVNTAILSLGNPEIELDPWVEIPLTEEAITNLIKQFGGQTGTAPTNPDTPKVPVNPVDPKVIAMLEDIIDFVNDLKDEYFDLNSDGYYEFNQVGETALINIVLTHAEGKLTKTEIEEVLETVDYSIKFKTNEKYLTSVRIEIVVKNQDVEIGTISFAGSFDRFNEVSFNIPTKVTSIEDFIAKLQASMKQPVK